MWMINSPHVIMQMRYTKSLHVFERSNKAGSIYFDAIKTTVNQANASVNKFTLACSRMEKVEESQINPLLHDMRRLTHVKQLKLSFCYNFFITKDFSHYLSKFFASIPKLEILAFGMEDLQALKEQDLAVIIRSFSENLQNLKELSLKFRNLRALTKGNIDLLAGWFEDYQYRLLTVQSLKRVDLNLSKNIHFKPPFAANLSLMLQSLPNTVESVCINLNEIVRFESQDFDETLRGLASLSPHTLKVYVGYNVLDGQTIGLPKELIKTQVSTLKSLTLAHNTLKNKERTMIEHLTVA
jgi:hypothetical protein